VKECEVKRVWDLPSEQMEVFKDFALERQEMFVVRAKDEKDVERKSSI
jgi:hypothetical protein